jgi:hypothetical protein
MNAHIYITLLLLLTAIPVEARAVFGKDIRFGGDDTTANTPTTSMTTSTSVTTTTTTTTTTTLSPTPNIGDFFKSISNLFNTIFKYWGVK